jgi:hypothetical protein
VLVIPPRQRVWLARLFKLDLALLVLVLVWVLSQAFPSSEAVRLRNALVLDGVVTPAQLAWAPAQAPADFRLEHAQPSAFFSTLAQARPEYTTGGSWPRAQALGRSLQVKLDDKGPIMKGLEESYTRIVEQGEGYCGDFADVFTALAHAAGIVTRQWSFSFDGYGGHGHIFNEVWDDQAGKWRAIDLYNNYLFVDPESGEALSALEFRAALRGERPMARIQPFNPEARVGFVIPEKALAYYRNGMDQWYLWWGNDVFSANGNPTVEALGKVSRHVEQLAAIIEGVQPRMRIIETPESAPRIAHMEQLKGRLILAAEVFCGLFALALVLGLLLLLQPMKAERVAHGR